MNEEMKKRKNEYKKVDEKERYNSNSVLKVKNHDMNFHQTTYVQLHSSDKSVHTNQQAPKIIKSNPTFQNNRGDHVFGEPNSENLDNDISYSGFFEDERCLKFGDFEI